MFKVADILATSPNWKVKNPDSKFGNNELAPFGPTTVIEEVAGIPAGSP